MTTHFKRIQSILFVIFISLSICAQNKILKVEIEGKKYDSLFVYDFREVHNRCKIEGVKQTDNTWMFTIPDSIYDLLPEFEIIPKIFDFTNKISSRIRFTSSISNDTTFTNRLNFQDELTYIKANYNKTSVFDSIRFFSQLPNSKYKTNIIGQIKIDYCVIDNSSSSDAHIRMLEPYFSTFLNIHNREYNYNEFLDYYYKLAKKYPASRYLIINLASNLDKYHFAKDVELIYNALSNKYKNTFWGENIERFIKNEFENTELYSSKGILEPIIKHTKKYNLIVFSASWCGPCHKQIPILKELYQNLKEKLEITYISIDSSTTIDAWNTLMKKENIPWRSLLAKDRKEYVEKIYFVQAIPHAILVTPSMQKLVVDVRKAEDKKRLYKLISK